MAKRTNSELETELLATKTILELTESELANLREERRQLQQDLEDFKRKLADSEFYREGEKERRELAEKNVMILQDQVDDLERKHQDLLDKLLDRVNVGV